MSLYTNKYFKLQLSLCIALFLNVSCGLSQTNPAITSWLQNTTVTGKYYVSGNSTPLSNGILVNCQQVRYSSNYVYINTRGIPSYATGPFSDGNPSIASDQNAIFKFPLNPVKNNGTPTNTNAGNIGVFINGVALFDYRDGVAWNANTNALCVSKALVNTQDLFATILELAGHSTWKEEINDNIIIDSKSLLPILKNSASEVRPWSYTEVFDISPNASVNSRAIRNNKYKLIYFDSLQTKEFYNLSIDLNENVNLLTDTLNEEECANFNYLCNEMSVLLGRNICDVLVSPTITITADKETICTGENVTFTSTITNTNANISYQWKKNGANVGSNSHVYSDSSLENNDVVTCILKENGLCLSSTISNSIKLNVSSKATPVITATASSDKICEGTEVMFNANILYGGTTPIYKWTRNGQHVGSNSPSYADQTLQNGDKISCELTSNATCITSEKVLSDNILIMVTSKVTPAIAISTSSTTINNGEKVVFSANTSNEGSSPVFQWIKNGSTIGENSSTYVDSNLVSGDIIYCKLLSNGFCLNSNEAVSNQIIITVITSGKEIEEIDIFQIFPIPVTDILLVQITDFARNNFEIKLYDISGRMIESKMLIQGSTLVSFDTQKLYSGEYIIHISDHTKTKSVIKKVIIQK